MRRWKAPIKIRHTGTTAAGEPVWAMRLKDDATVQVEITKIQLYVSFDGTVATTHAAYTIERYDTFTMTGGVQIVPSPVAKAGTAIQVTDVRDILAGTGLVDTSVANIEELAIVGLPRSATGHGQMFEFGPQFCYLRNLGNVQQGQGLAIVLDNTAVVGDGLNGYVEWEETEVGRA